MLQPLIQYLLIVAGLIASLALFFALKRESQKNARKHIQRIEEMSKRLNESWDREPQHATAIVPRSGMNLNKRVQAVRMLRRGEDLAHIAAALQVPRREVELLIRVQEIGKAKSKAAGS